MKLKKATDYAFVILAHLGTIPDGESTNSRKVAKECKIPERFLANIVHSLSKSGIIESRKGMKGGISLAKDSSKITLRDVIEAIEGNIGFVDCQKSKGICHIENECSVKHFWDVQNDKILAPLNSTTLEDFMSYTNSTVKKKS
jgi:Rrf2 family protein